MKKYGRKGISYNSMNVRGQVEDDIVCVCVWAGKIAFLN